MDTTILGAALYAEVAVSGRHWIGGGKGGKELLGPRNNFWRDMFFLQNWR
jgi:hypothetical protein